jgi:hypothetical protein
MTISGRPQPDVSWFMNGNLVDDEYEHNSGNIIENRLLWPSLQRVDLYSVFTCRAANTKAVAPREKRLVLDMYRKFPVISSFILLLTLLSRALVYSVRNKREIVSFFFCCACISNHLMTLTSSFYFFLFFSFVFSLSPIAASLTRLPSNFSSFSDSTNNVQ